MSLYKRKNMWWMDVRINSVRKRLPTGTESKKLAETIHAKVLTDIQEGKWFEKQLAKTKTFNEMTEKYLSKYGKQRDYYSVKRLIPFFGHIFLSEITTELVSDYRDQRLKTVKPATVYQELAFMRHVFNVARKEWKWVKENPVADLSFAIGNKNARTRWLTVEEERSLLHCATNPSWLKNLIVLALHTGMRRGEILNLNWQDIEFFRKLLTVQKSKNGEKRSIPLSKTLQNTLLSMKVRDISCRVFPISIRSLRVSFDNALEKAKIENFHFHDLRHTFATRLVQNGVDLYKVKELLGHKTITMTMRYAHHYPESLRASVETLDLGHNLDTIAVACV